MGRIAKDRRSSRGRDGKSAQPESRAAGTPASPAEPSPPAPSRRSFLSKFWLVLGGVAVAELAWITISFLRPRRSGGPAGDSSAVIVAGPVERFEPYSVTAFRRGKFHLVRLKDGGFLALHRKCTHLGCTVPWIADEQRFACPCHASVFDIRGDVLSPPAPRPLDLYAVRIENGIVKVDTSRPIRRSSFEPGQVTRG